MSIDDLTLGQIMQLSSLNLDGSSASDVGVAARMMGKYVIVRSRNEGINAGEVVEADDTGVVLKNARRMWYHKPAVKSESWYEGVANHGLSDDSKVSGVVREKVIIEDYSMVLCTDIARQSIEAAVANAQS